jgi:hypothetical protein
MAIMTTLRMAILSNEPNLLNGCQLDDRLLVEAVRKNCLRTIEGSPITAEAVLTNR